MRKLFVALLILSVMGGAFAQDEEAEVKGEGKWGGFTGSAEFASTISLGAGVDDNGKSIAFVNDNMRIGRSGLNAELALRWDYTKGDWSIALPFTVNKRGISTMSYDGGWDGKNAKVVYNPDSPIKVEIPFAFVIDDDFELLNNSFLNTSWYNGLQKSGNGVGIVATYTGENYSFGAEYSKIFKDKGEADPAKVWGKYQFMDNKLTVAAAYKGGVNTDWWRASTIAYGGNIDFNYKDARYKSKMNGFAADYGTEHSTRFGQEHPARNFGNIAEGGGLAIRFDINESLNAGIAWRDGDGGSSLFDIERPAGYNFAEEFLLQPIFGVGFNNGSIAASAVVQVSNYQKNVDTGKDENPKDGKNDWEVQTAPMAHMAFGLKFTGVENLTVAADFSVFDMGKVDSNEAYVNIGFTAQYKLPLGLTFDLKFVGYDLGYVRKPTDYATPKEDNYNYTSRGNKKAIGFEAIVNYANDFTDVMNLGVKAGLSFVHMDQWAIDNEKVQKARKDLGLEDYGKYIGNAVRAGIAPTITWKVIPDGRGTISLGYDLGLILDNRDPNLMTSRIDPNDLKKLIFMCPAVFKNDIKATFKYTF